MAGPRGHGTGHRPHARIALSRPPPQGSDEFAIEPGFDVPIPRRCGAMQWSVEGSGWPGPGTLGRSWGTERMCVTPLRGAARPSAATSSRCRRRISAPHSAVGTATTRVRSSTRTAYVDDASAPSCRAATDGHARSASVTSTSRSIPSSRRARRTVCASGLTSRLVGAMGPGRHTQIPGGLRGAQQGALP